jgi:tRNA (cytidine/uridine-2'-O-)-methyltransferase
VVKNSGSNMPRLHIVLYEPEIPPNTGNIARLCAGNDVPLHLVGKLGFKIDDKHLKRAGLDPARIFGLSARAEPAYTDIRFQPGDAILFGCESRGLPPEFVERLAGRMFVIPMSSGKIRSLNLSTAVGIVAYEAFRQFGTESRSR